MNQDGAPRMVDASEIPCGLVYLELPNYEDQKSKRTS